uniref:Uncharacterized protein n=1 Tax=Zea mays TaxID=4577 RepID=B4FGI0_MAIZE|nr:unknown [Zea mays]
MGVHAVGWQVTTPLCILQCFTFLIFLFAPSGLNPYKCTWHWLPICRFITSHEKDACWTTR